MLSPLACKHWTLKTAAHLLNRAGFGGAPREIKALHELGMERAVGQLINGTDDAQAFPLPEGLETQDPLRELREMRDITPKERLERRKEIDKHQRDLVAALTQCWLGRMRKSQWPLREKLVLFWHGHFASGQPKVKNANYLWQQNELFRTHALGNFVALTKFVSRDPAMMQYLDTIKNAVGKPNENFARELMELFTLGIGQYTEEDIREAARAFTGYRINPKRGSFIFASRLHDDGSKKFFGRQGRFSGDDIIDMIVARPECSEFIAGKLWEFFAYEDPAPELVKELGAVFRQSRYELKPLLERILGSQEFYSAKAWRSQIKSPVQLLVQTSKMLESELPQQRALTSGLRELGQIPFAPPSVKGWDGGQAWITTATLLARYNLSKFMLGGGTLPRSRNSQRPIHLSSEAKVDFAKIVPERSNPEAMISQLAERLFQEPIDPRQSATLQEFLAKHTAPYDDPTVCELMHLMMSTPRFQLT